MAQAPTVDEYIAGLPADRRVPMEELRRTVKAAAPDATEVITYKMPGLRDAGGFLVSYDSYKNHYSLFPATDAVIAALGDEVMVVVTEIDRQGRVNLSRKAAMQRHLAKTPA